MFSSTALRLRSVIAPNLFAALLVTALPAQTPSAAIAALSPVAQHDRIVAHPGFAPLTQLSRQLPVWAQSGHQTSARSVDLTTTIHIALILRRDPAVQAAFEQLLADQQNPASLLYHQWLTPQQVGSLFGPTPNDLAALTTWLTSQGLTVDSLSPSGVILHASATAAIIGNALHTSFAYFDREGDPAAAPRLSAVSEPSIPSALAPLIDSIQGLSELTLRPMSRVKAVHRSIDLSAPNPASGLHPLLTFSDGTRYLTPGDFDVIYDIAGLHASGNTGTTLGSKAQHVAVIGDSRAVNTDITDFEAIVGLPSVTPTVVLAGTDPGTNDDGGEATLDVDRVMGTAPGATVDLVVAKTTNTTNGVFEAIQYNVDTLLDPVMTISFGNCETDAGSVNVSDVNQIAMTAASEGITTLVSSGDSGAAGCDVSLAKAPSVQTASINFICSSSYVTCVGGTEFNDTANPSTYWSATNSSTYVSALSYIPEGGWNEPSDPTSTTVPFPVAASGGGVSLYIAKPTWQTGTGVPSGSFRFVPDVSFSAADHDGYFGCLASVVTVCKATDFVVFSGTSAAAPGMAGVVALVNTKLGVAVGNINPQLYALATSTPSVFHDATIATSGVSGCTLATPSLCNNSTPGPSGLVGGLDGFELTTGYDEVTGLGSIDVANLVAAATAPSGGGGGTPSFTLAASPATLTLNAGATTGNTSTLTATSTDSFNSAIALTCSVAFTGAGAATDTPTCSFSPASITPAANGTATATLTIASTASSTTTCPASALKLASSTASPWLGGSAGIVLAGLLLLLPLRKRRSLRALALLCVCAAGVASISGCGGGGTTSGPSCTPTTVPGTTSGSYTVKVTGTGGTTVVVVLSAVTVTIN
jgi:pseudomonalisin